MSDLIMHRYACIIVLLAGFGQAMGRVAYSGEMIKECKIISGVGAEPTKYHLENIGLLCNSTCFIVCLSHKRHGDQSLWYANGTLNVDRSLAKANAIRIDDFDMSPNEFAEYKKNMTERIKYCSQESQRHPYSESSPGECPSQFCHEVYVHARCSEPRLPTVQRVNGKISIYRPAAEKFTRNNIDN